MWILLGNRRKRRPNIMMVGASCALMLLSTAEMALNVIRVYQGFVAMGPSLPGGPEQYFENISLPTFVAKSCLISAQSLILDIVVIFRAYVVWQSLPVVILPILSWIGLLVVSIGTNVSLAGMHPSGGLSLQDNPWITSMFTLYLATNLSATALLAYKIWTVTRGTSQYRSSEGLAPVLRVALESGAIYTITMSAGLILFLLQSQLVYALIDISSPIISIVMNMIIVRVGLAAERKKHLRAAPRQSGSGFSFVAVTIPKPHPGYLRERPDSEMALSVPSDRVDDDVEMGNVVMKMERLLQDGGPSTPYSESGTTDDAKSVVDVDDPEDVKSVDLALTSARSSAFHVITERDLD
ncbi:hypothetical protein BD311DRAFT_780880 [Dichomitus squalens]|uniref:Uncharacterized protein n=1 Tax=Dichomitus squalens TaxID=114155 RepID=A0A4V2JZC7_9APHY|nr:hypothetical protein BD311DRAFT_780880 [Dichomitus squalens]